MRIIILGYGVQGPKRREIAGEDCIAIVDPVSDLADWKSIRDVPLNSYDSALVCTPDHAKLELIRYLLKNKKHVLVEKPLVTENSGDLLELSALATDLKLCCYTAYNHRFEPHFVKVRDLVESGVLGNIYRCRMFYGNGTARLVRNSVWRDKGAGVLPDLASHLLDAAAFWFGEITDGFRVVSADRFENKSFDHVVLATSSDRPKLELEVTLLSWRNHFSCDIFAEKGSAHIEGLSKWGGSTLTIRNRKLPSGRPDESREFLVSEPLDKTWQLEYQHFLDLCAKGENNLNHDVWINNVLNSLTEEALSKF